MKFRALCLGDLHLGRRPARLPSDPTNPLLAPDQLCPLAVWKRAVDEALALDVDAVLFTGDVVDTANRYFETLGPLADGVRRLDRAHVPCVAVAGNHDFDLLPRLQAEIPELRVIGQGGRWETLSLEGRSGLGIDLVGWSFPAASTDRVPLDSLPARGSSGHLRCGLLHADLDQPKSRYAPVSSRDLAACDVDLWLLGHVHKPSPFDGAGEISPAATRAPRREPGLGYLGSILGLDSTETGWHGPWLLEVDHGSTWRMRPLPLSSLRWEEITVSVAELETPGDLRVRLAKSVHERHDELSADLESCQLLGFRVRLVGRSQFRRELRDLTQSILQEDALLLRDGRALWIERFLDETRPEIDLEALATGHDPPAFLARTLLQLEPGDAARDERAARELVVDARRLLESVDRDSRWEPLPRRELSDAEVVELLTRSGLQALESLIEQREERPGVGERAVPARQGELF